MISNIFGDGGQQVRTANTEMRDARGSANSLNSRLSVITSFASPNVGPYISGQYYDTACHGTAAGTIAGAANRVEMMPFTCNNSFLVTEIGVSVSTAASGALGKCFIYEASANGLPDTLLWEAGGNLDFGTTGFKFHTTSQTLYSGKVYWLGLRHSAAATVRGVAVASAANLGLNTSNGTAYNCLIRSTITYANALPNTWTFASSQLTSSIAPSIRMKSGGEV